MSISSSSSSTVVVRPLVIVVADDTPELLTQYRTWLESRGHVVLTATSGNEAVRIIRRQQVDVVVAEVIMANGDGLEVLQQLKIHQPAARIIAVSAGGRYLPASDCLRVAKGLGAHEALMKPLTRSDLFDTIDRITVHLSPASSSAPAATASATIA
jgi:CheY-like chemotaxis protein